MHDTTCPLFHFSKVGNYGDMVFAMPPSGYYGMSFTFPFSSPDHAATVTNVEVEIVSDTSVVVSWDAVNLQVTGYIVYYHNLRNASTEAAIRVPNSVNSTVVENLVNNSIYIFQVAAFLEYDGTELLGQNSSITDTSIILFLGLGMLCTKLDQPHAHNYAWGGGGGLGVSTEPVITHYSIQQG